MGKMFASKCEDPSSIPQYACEKVAAVAHSCNSNNGEEEIHILGDLLLANLAKLGSSCLKKERGRWKPTSTLILTHVNPHMPTYTYIQKEGEEGGNKKGEEQSGQESQALGTM